MRARETSVVQLKFPKSTELKMKTDLKRKRDFKAHFSLKTGSPFPEKVRFESTPKS